MGKYKELKEQLDRIENIIIGQVDKPMTVAEAAEFLGFSNDRIYKGCYNGEIPFHKIFGRNKFLKSELLDWVKSKK